ncbi:MAG: helix-turn-helix domain-containing protein [Elusimicrobiota bacterium]|jgi:excisionase family DNA binding protein
MDKLLTVSEVAELLQVKPGTIYQWVHEGYIPILKIGSLVRFDKTSITAWLRSREVAGRRRRTLTFEIEDAQLAR